MAYVLTNVVPFLALPSIVLLMVVAGWFAKRNAPLHRFVVNYRSVRHRRGGPAGVIFKAPGVVWGQVGQAGACVAVESGVLVVRPQLRPFAVMVPSWLIPLEELDCAETMLGTFNRTGVRIRAHGETMILLPKWPAPFLRLLRDVGVEVRPSPERFSLFS